MFTGIIRHKGEIKKITSRGSSLEFTFQSPLALELQVDQSISHNGICLTVEEIDGDRYTVTAVKETILRSTAGHWKKGQKVNLETSATPTTLLDGHLVQGHVDCFGTVSKIEEVGGSWYFYFSIPASYHPLVVEKGSIAIDGVSLTVAEVTEEGFYTAIIPFTYEHTGFRELSKNDKVNIELDVIGKYVARLMAFKKTDTD